MNLLNMVAPYMISAALQPTGLQSPRQQSYDSLLLAMNKTAPKQMVVDSIESDSLKSPVALYGMDIRNRPIVKQGQIGRGDKIYYSYTVSDENDELSIHIQDYRVTDPSIDEVYVSFPVGALSSTGAIDLSQIAIDAEGADKHGVIGFWPLTRKTKPKKEADVADAHRYDAICELAQNLIRSVYFAKSR